MDVQVADGATVGVAYAEETEAPSLGSGSVIRTGTVVYDDVVSGSNLQTGHHALIREGTTLGDDVLVGTHAVIDGYSQLGDCCSLQTGAYVSTRTKLGNRVFLGPQATLLNDAYPVRRDEDLDGPTLEDDVTVGANATVLPGVTIGEEAFVSAGAVVTKDVPPRRLIVGVPGRAQPLPAELTGGNDL